MPVFSPFLFLVANYFVFFFFFDKAFSLRLRCLGFRRSGKGEPEKNGDLWFFCQSSPCCVGSCVCVCVCVCVRAVARAVGPALLSALWLAAAFFALRRSCPPKRNRRKNSPKGKLCDLFQKKRGKGRIFGEKKKRPAREAMPTTENKKRAARWCAPKKRRIRPGDVMLFFCVAYKKRRPAKKEPMRAANGRRRS
nr:hypothetical protein [Pandoravirus massiliensis]